MTASAIVTLLFVSGAMPVRLEPAATRAWLLSTYPPAVARGEAAYDRLMMSIACENWRESGQREIVSARFAAFDGQIHLDFLRDDSAQFADLYFMRPGDSLIVHRENLVEGRPFCTVQPRDFESLISGIRSSYSLPFAPWYTGDLAICKMLSADDVSIHCVTLTDDPDLGRLCTVDWSYCIEHPRPPFGSFCFAVDRGWVLLSQTRMTDRRNGFVVRLDYDDSEIAGIPVIRSAEHSVIADGRQILKRRFERMWFTPLEAPADLIDPTVYRIASVLSPPVPVKPRLWRTALPAMIGLILLSLAIQVWRLQRGYLHPSSRRAGGPIVERQSRRRIAQDSSFRNE
ncbi:hypothetical protein Mal4_34010 [Maioricimonas rarisocia]|uniref:Uncharacterized protein n=1 Tax=Maioricimonas rarisocia TaxID=2528026 RepID=A0A517Z9B9_9PLAN|nr:hypothetical protein [Maioricimonas rarisocia]QDU39066.1 hypothetical protein Mal4_34010 [Maioricimonas rarisocia]